MDTDPVSEDCYGMEGQDVMAQAWRAKGPIPVQYCSLFLVSKLVMRMGHGQYSSLNLKRGHAVVRKLMKVVGGDMLGCRGDNNCEG
eukprot:g40707.t1